MSRRRWVMRLALVSCPHCAATVDTTQQAGSASENPPFWRPDTKQVYVRCPECHSFFKAFVYPLFNWLPLSRVLTGLAVLNGLVIIFLLLTAW